MVAIVAFDAAEDWRRCVFLCPDEALLEREAIAEAGSEASGFGRGLEVVGDTREVIAGVLSDNRPAVLACLPYRVLEEPFAVDEPNVERAAYFA